MRWDNNGFAVNVTYKLQANVRRDRHETYEERHLAIL
jgi:hypothetical protein